MPVGAWSLAIGIVWAIPGISACRGWTQCDRKASATISRRLNKTTGIYRLFAECQVEDPTGQPDGYIRIRLDQTADDELAGYHRPEHLRAFPESDQIFADIQRPLRAAAESANRTIADHLPRESLHHYGFTTNHLSMPAWQAHRNAQIETISSTRHQPTAVDPPLPRAS